MVKKALKTLASTLLLLALMPTRAKASNLPIEEIKTPQEAQQYIQKRFKKSESQTASETAKTILSDDNFQYLEIAKLHLTTYKKERYLLIYQENNKYGSIGLEDRDCKPAQYSSICELVSSMN
ncbi:hypothetical protein HY643_02560 [Candidatus Woesearchaeota archaeon]|nr:hypothetical protein [Candidatus Woesearchaeota archaeon]